MEGKNVTDEYTEDIQLEQIHIYDKGSALFATCSEQYRKLKKKFWFNLLILGCSGVVQSYLV